MKEIPDSVVVAYVAVAVRMHGDAGADIGDAVTGPDEGEEFALGVWRVKDGWGTYYFQDPPRGAAVYLCCKMEDVMAYDVAENIRGKITKERVKALGMGDEAWDAAVLSALGGE